MTLQWTDGMLNLNRRKSRNGGGVNYSAAAEASLTTVWCLWKSKATKNPSLPPLPPPLTKSKWKVKKKKKKREILASGELLGCG